MPEALVIFAVLGVAIAAYLTAWLQARDPANDKPAEELVRLGQHEAWLRQRLHLAERENWDTDMTRALTTELAQISQQRTRAQNDIAAAS